MLARIKKYVSSKSTELSKRYSSTLRDLLESNMHKAYNAFSVCLFVGAITVSVILTKANKEYDDLVKKLQPKFSFRL